MTAIQELAAGELPKPYEQARTPHTVVFPRDTMISVQYRTTEEALAALLPPGFVPAKPAVIFRYRCAEGLDWVEGGSVSMMGVAVPARYREVDGSIEGVFWPAVWETDFVATIGGVMLMGVPKRLGEIDVSRDVNGHTRCVLSVHHRPVMEFGFEHGPELTGDALEAVRDAAGQVRTVFGYRQILSFDQERVELAQPACFPTEATIHRAWRGRGEVKVFEVDPELLRYTLPAVEAIAAVPLLENLGATFVESSGSIAIGDGRVLG